MIDATSAIDPLVAEGPREPLDSLRPAVSLQRVLLLDEPGPMMADLATGDIRRYESGPPVSVPMTSDTFDLGCVRRMQIQVIRDPRPTSIGQTLVWLDLGSAASIDVRITPTDRLELLASGAGEPRMVSAHAGVSPAFVIVIEQVDGQVTVAVRNAESMEFTSITLEAMVTADSVLTVCGPSPAAGRGHGRRRAIPVHIDISHVGPTGDRRAIAVRAVRKLARVLRNRMG